MPFARNNHDVCREVCEDFIAKIKAEREELLNKPKFHLLLHLPRCMEDFGRTSSFNTERL